MQRRFPHALLLAAALAGAGCAHRPAEQVAALEPFSGEAELAAYHAALIQSLNYTPPPPPPPSAPPAPGDAAAPTLSRESADESVTNVQHAGVDEGGIVKVHGDHLVVLRRGRLFTVRIGDGELRPVSAVDAFAPDLDPSGAWYDEMLISGDLIAVIGYSYFRGGTEVGLFRIDAEGGLTHRATYNLRSSDYYSSRGYASRLVGGKLVLYTPIPLDPWEKDPFARFPAIRRWGDAEFRRTAEATRVYRPAAAFGAGDLPVLHTVTVCDPDDDRLSCRSTALFGPEGSVFYVSPAAVYVWTSHYRSWRNRTPIRSILYRMPLDGSAPTGLRVEGEPVDALSFLESADRHLNVLVRRRGGGGGMWAAESSEGAVALLRVPLGDFGDGSRAAPASAYRHLPDPGGGAFHNRFVGDWLLYGTGGRWRPTEGGKGELVAVRWAGSGVERIPLPHGVERIESMGAGAVVVGEGDGSLHLTGVRLGADPAVAHRYSRSGVAQGETRTHGFFYRSEGGDRGLLGLPVRAAQAWSGSSLRQGSASVLFLRDEGLRLTELGDLAASPASAADDGCRASCVDWYGNARPLFLRGRIFALLGYELVEGELSEGRIRELRRASFAPTVSR